MILVLGHLAQTLLPNSHQPKQKWADGGMTEIKVNPTQVSEKMNRPVLSADVISGLTLALAIIAAGVTVAVVAFLNQGRRKRRRRRRTTPTWSLRWSHVKERVTDSLADFDFPDFDLADFDFFSDLDLPEFDFEHTVIAQGRALKIGKPSMKCVMSIEVKYERMARLWAACLSSFLPTVLHSSLGCKRLLSSTLQKCRVL